VVGGLAGMRSDIEPHSCKQNNRISTGIAAEMRLGDARTVTLKGVAACLE
jgi:hypothetical protein